MVVALLVAAVPAFSRLFPCCISYIDPIKQLVAVFRNYGRVCVAHDGGGATAEEISWCEQISRENERGYCDFVFVVGPIQ